MFFFSSLLCAPELYKITKVSGTLRMVPKNVDQISFRDLCSHRDVLHVLRFHFIVGLMHSLAISATILHKLVGTKFVLRNIYAHEVPLCTVRLFLLNAAYPG